MQLDRVSKKRTSSGGVRPSQLLEGLGNSPYKTAFRTDGERGSDSSAFKPFRSSPEAAAKVAAPAAPTAPRTLQPTKPLSKPSGIVSIARPSAGLAAPRKEASALAQKWLGMEAVIDTLLRTFGKVCDGFSGLFGPVKQGLPSGLPCSRSMVLSVVLSLIARHAAWASHRLGQPLKNLTHNHSQLSHIAVNLS